ncbi:hypothetical protein ACFVWU_16015, partial [Kitasatospora sp. NPDC058190]
MTAPALRVRPALAFFDVDETVIAEKSPVAFWRYWRDRHPGRGAAAHPAQWGAVGAPPPPGALKPPDKRREAG